MEWRLERNSFRDNTPVAHTGEPKHLSDTRPTFAKEVIGEATNTFLFSIFYFLKADTRVAFAVATKFFRELCANAHTKSPKCVASKSVSAGINGAGP